MKFKNVFVKFFHNVLGWGYPAYPLENDPFQPTMACKYCDMTLAQDSNGDWFHLTSK
jgi:hypothetical protein